MQEDEEEYIQQREWGKRGGARIKYKDSCLYVEDPEGSGGEP